MITQRRLFHGWIVVATSAAGLFLGAFPIVAFSFGVFFQPFVREFHAGRGAISLAFTLHNLISGVCAVFVGRIADRVGARKVILPGLGMLGLMLLLAETMGSQLWALYVFYCALGVVAPATTTLPYALVVSRWFDRRRGLAIGLMMVGLGTGAIVMPMLAQRLIAAFGWRTAFALAGCAILVIPIPIVALLLRDTPAEMGLLPDGETETAAPTAAGGRLDGLTWEESCRERYVLVDGDGIRPARGERARVCGSHAGTVCRSRRHATDRRDGQFRRRSRASRRPDRVRVFSGSLFWAVRRTRSLRPVCAGYRAPVDGYRGVLALAAAFLVGLGMGSEVDIIAFLMSRYFGLRSLGRTIGFAFGAFVVAGGIGPLVMGLSFDRTGSYRVPLAGFFVATLVAAALMSRLGPYRFGVRLGCDGRAIAGVEAPPQAS